MRGEFDYINPDIFGNRLKICMAEQNLTCEAMAEELELSTSSVQNWRRHSGFPSVDALAGVADVLNVSIDYLLGRKESKEI